MIKVLGKLLVQSMHLLARWAQACEDVAEVRSSQNQMS